MPVSYRIFDEPNLTLVTWEGRVTLEESAGNFVDYVTAGHAYSGRPVLFDCTRVTVLDIDFNEMLTFIAEKLAVIDPYEPSMLTAVVTDDDVIFEQWKIYERLVSESDRQFIATFRSFKPALAFLKVEFAAFEQVMSRS